jgi:hypothetical protein
MRHVVRISMALVALAAAALSYQSLAQLGQLCGYGSLSWLYPVVVDAGAAASCAAWLHNGSRQALGMTWSLLSISVALNGTTHWLESIHTAPSWPLVVAVAAVPPMVLGLCVHLAVGMGHDTAPPESPAPTRSLPTAGDRVPDADDPDPVAELIESGAGRRRLAKELDISEHRARQLIASRNGEVVR